MRHFTRALLNDVNALEYMLDHDWFESNIVRIGAEQEMCLIDTQDYKPASINMKIIELLKDKSWLETELAKFNLEVNLTPRVFEADCLSEMEQEIRGTLSTIQKVSHQHNTEIVLTGILPTLRKFDLEIHNLTPKHRYQVLMDAINKQLKRSGYELHISGIDELIIRHNTPLLEACNTSFQVHLQVSPNNFVPIYNIAQTITAPIIAISANSPILFGRRLWHESRIATFQQAIDTRASSDHLRQYSPRVNFGKDWLKKSILEIHREDITRFRPLMTIDIEEDPLQLISEGKVPRLKALQIHNSTIYRWNRPCYGISDNGKPHLRIENRVIPAGPTVVDEVANAAFWLGATVGMHEAYPNITNQIAWEDVQDNFIKAAKFGIDTQFTWFKDRKVTATELIAKELLPLARMGLEKQKIAQADIDRYLGIIQERAEAHATGARWQLRAYSKLCKRVSQHEAVSVLTACMVKNQAKALPVHKWKLPTPKDLENYRPSTLRVDEFMATDLLTVYKDDIIELISEIMHWNNLRHLAVEDEKGNLIGLVTSHLLLKYLSNPQYVHQKDVLTAKDIMIQSPVTIGPNATIIEAMRLMKKNKIGCLPVIKDQELIGMITEQDFLKISNRLIERLEEEE